jgi:hypothetical protein
MKKQMQPRSELAIVLHSLRQHFWVAGLFDVVKYFQTPRSVFLLPFLVHK